MHMKTGLPAHSGSCKKHFEAYPWVLDFRGSLMLAPILQMWRMRLRGPMQESCRNSASPGGHQELWIYSQNLPPAVCFRVHMG